MATKAEAAAAEAKVLAAEAEQKASDGQSGQQKSALPEKTEKDKMKQVKNETKSAMPVFGPERLSDSDLDDLLRYLQTLRGFNPAVVPR